MCTANLVVYVVEDDASVRRAVTRLLRAHGWRVVAFDSADAFLRARPWEPVACLLLDIQMPGMTGWELLAACRRDNAMANYKALRLVRSRPFVPEKPQERIRENPGA